MVSWDAPVVSSGLSLWLRCDYLGTCSLSLTADIWPGTVFLSLLSSCGSLVLPCVVNGIVFAGRFCGFVFPWGSQSLLLRKGSAKILYRDIIFLTLISIGFYSILIIYIWIYSNKYSNVFGFSMLDLSIRALYIGFLPLSHFFHRS